jgi:CubicO group peptidase (beta-lactamase class C family)
MPNIHGPRLTGALRRDLLRWMAAAPAAAMAAGPLVALADTALEPIAPGLLSFTPENQAATFRNIDRLYATHRIARGAEVMSLPAHGKSLAGLTFDHQGATYSIDQYMARNRTAGVLVLKDGQVALERYGMGNTPASRWTSMSVAKSVTSTLVGAALKDGSIASLDDPVTRYVPLLKGSAYEGVQVRQLLRMTSGVAWNEAYTASGDSDVAKLAGVLQARKKGGLLELMRNRGRAAPPDTKFLYSTGETTVEGAVVIGATGKPLSAYLSEKIWAPAGMETDAYWLAEAEDGIDFGGGCISATLRDYARFGQFFLNEGVIGSSSILPAGWRDLAGRPDNPVTACGKVEPGSPLGYGYNWWTFPTGTAPFPGGVFSAQGIFGQFIYVNPPEKVVAAIWSAWPEAWVEASELETYSLLAKAVATLRA